MWGHFNPDICITFENTVFVSFSENKIDFSCHTPVAVSFELASNGTGLQELMHSILHNFNSLHTNSWSHWLRGLRRRYAAARLLRLWVRIPRGHGCFVCCECCVCFLVDASATSWSLVQRSPVDCGVSLCVIWKPREWGGPGPRGCRAKNKQTY